MTVFGLAAVLAIAQFAAAQDAKKSTPNVAGNWSVAVTSPHGSVEMTLALKQDGAKITGTLSSSHTGDRAVEGEFTDGTLKLATTTGAPEEQLALTAHVKDGVTMTGYLSSGMGDMDFTGSRSKDK
jgi:hypothetical protein